MAPFAISVACSPETIGSLSARNHQTDRQDCGSSGIGRERKGKLFENKTKLNPKQLPE